MIRQGQAKLRAVCANDGGAGAKGDVTNKKEAKMRVELDFSGGLERGAEAEER